MWPFCKKKKSLMDTGMFNGFSDRHSHILPGVDDGIQTMDAAIDVLRYYRQIGVREVWLTPHIMEDIPNTPQELRERFEELCAEVRKAETEDDCKLPLLHLAAENMIDSLFVKRLESGELLPYGDEGKELLVETSYVQAPYGFRSILQDIQKAGYIPVLAHPERYAYMDDEDYEKLHQQGIRFQLNVSSLAGAYGLEARDNAEYLLEEGWYSYYGSDLHSLRAFSNAIEKPSLRSDVARVIGELSV